MTLYNLNEIKKVKEKKYLEKKNKARAFYNSTTKVDLSKYRWVA